MLENNVKYEYTKTPLDYQITEYDCGTTTLLNALRYLFKRNEISPEIYKFILQYTLDKSNIYGEVGKGGTSVYALEFLCQWLNDNGKKKSMNIKCTSLPNNEISIYNEMLNKKINNGAVAIIKLYQDCDHYCLLTKIDEEYAYLFDPYYLNINYYDKDKDIEIVKDKPFEYNRKVTKSRMDSKTKKDFSIITGKDAGIIVIEKIKLLYKE